MALRSMISLFFNFLSKFPLPSNKLPSKEVTFLNLSYPTTIGASPSPFSSKMVNAIFLRMITSFRSESSKYTSSIRFTTWAFFNNFSGMAFAGYLISPACTHIAEQIRTKDNTIFRMQLFFLFENNLFILFLYDHIEKLTQILIFIG